MLRALEKALGSANHYNDMRTKCLLNRELYHKYDAMFCKRNRQAWAFDAYLRRRLEQGRMAEYRICWLKDELEHARALLAECLDAAPPTQGDT